MKSFRKAAVIGLLAALPGAQIARADDLRLYGPQIGPPSVYYPLKPQESPEAIALEQRYTLMYAHDPARPPLVIVNRPPDDGPNVVSARY